MGRRLADALRVSTSLFVFATAASLAPDAHGQEIVRQWFGDVREFYRRAAAAGRAVLFNAKQ